MQSRARCRRRTTARPRFSDPSATALPITPSSRGKPRSRSAIAKARLDPARTEARAPAAGVIANADRLLVGQQVVPGIGMLSLVAGEEALIEANFKEKDLARMVPG